MSLKFFIEVFGCQMNVYDSKRIVDSLASFGFDQTQDPKTADILIFYTCNIREKAAQKLFSQIGMLKNQNTKVVCVGGCVAQAEGRNIFKRSSDVNIVFGPQTFHQLPEYINSVLKNPEKRIIDVEFSQGEKFQHLPKREKVSFSEFITIQEGCDNFCTYCVVPYTRGREYSRPVRDIIEEAKWLLENGAKELVLIGQNVNSYHGEAPYITIGQSRGTWRIERLIQEISNLPGLKRLRYTTSHPKDFSEELMKVHAENKILVPFTHIPVQSGNDRILKAMNRGHTADAYLDKLKRFRDICPEIQFSSDFIVGFPTETDEEFLDTVDLAKKAKYTISYSFKYSPRKNTPAEKMPLQIQEEVKEERLKILQDALKQDQIYFNQALVGKTQEVLFEKKGKKENQYIGKNVCLQSVIVESDHDLIGDFKKVRIESAGENSVFGKILDE